MSALLLRWGSYRWARNLWVLIVYLFFFPVMLPSVVPRLAIDSAMSVSWCLETSLFKTPFPGQSSVPISCVSFFLSFIFFPTSFRRQWAAFLGVWCPLLAFRSCFVEFTQRLNVLLMNLWGEKVVSPSYSSAILGPPPKIVLLRKILSLKKFLSITTVCIFGW